MIKKYIPLLVFLFTVVLVVYATAYSQSFSSLIKELYNFPSSASYPYPRGTAKEVLKFPSSAPLPYSLPLMVERYSFPSRAPYPYPYPILKEYVKFPSSAPLPYLYSRIGETYLLTGNKPPYAPTNPYPANNSVDVITTTLSWAGGDPDGDPVVYYVYIGTDPSAMAFYTKTTSTSVSVSLQTKTQYWWKVIASDGKANTTSKFTFTTGNRPPNTPSNPIPENGATGIAQNITLSWTGGDPDNDPVTYYVYFGKDPSNLQLYTTTTSTSVTLSNLEKATMYYWYVIAKDKWNATAIGSTWAFATTGSPPPTPPSPSPPTENHPPNVPIYLIPDGATNMPLDVTLAWVGGDPDNDKVTYEVYFGKEAVPPLYANITSTEIKLKLEPGTTYYWYVKARDSRGATSKGGTYRFTTAYPPYPPSPIYPQNNSKNLPLNIKLQWKGGDPANNPVTYMVFLDVTPKPRAIMRNTTVEYMELTNLLPGTTYYWKIYAINNKGAMSDPVYTFTTTHAPYTPANPYPADGATNIPISVTLSWAGGDPDGDRVTYSVYIGTDPSNIPFYTNTTSTSVTVSLEKDTTYYWYIVAIDDKGATAKGSTWKFSTVGVVAQPYAPAVAPQVPQLPGNISGIVGLVSGIPIFYLLIPAILLALVFIKRRGKVKRYYR